MTVAIPSSMRIAHGAIALRARAGEGNGMAEIAASDAIAPTPTFSRTRGREHNNATR